MPTATYIALANYTVPSGGAASVTFSSIPATYRDLVLVANGVAEPSQSGSVRVRFNSDTTDANYSRVFMQGSGAGNTASGATNGHFFFDLYDSFGQPTILQIMDYSATDKHKTVLTRWSGTTSYVVAAAHRWANTNAITTIALVPNGFEFAQGFTIDLYGIVS
jgi:hypothetical protein